MCDADLIEQQYCAEEIRVVCYYLSATMIRGFSILATSLLAIIGCGEQSAPPSVGSPSELFRQYRDTPIGKSVVPVTKGLRNASLYLPIDSGATNESTMLRLHVSSDKSGANWAYAYTSPDEITKAFPQGSHYAKMPFADAFKMIDQNESLRGIFINASSEDSYILPREVFDEVHRVLSQIDD